jgi:hypothetical protein
MPGHACPINKMQSWTNSFILGNGDGGGGCRACALKKKVLNIFMVRTKPRQAAEFVLPY